MGSTPFLEEELGKQPPNPQEDCYQCPMTGDLTNEHMKLMKEIKVKAAANCAALKAKAAAPDKGAAMQVEKPKTVAPERGAAMKETKAKAAVPDKHINVMVEHATAIVPENGGHEGREA